MGKLKRTTLYLDEDDVRLCRMLNISVSKIVRDAVRYAIAGRKEEIKELLRAEVEKRLEALKPKPAAPPCPRCGKPMREVTIAYIGEKGEDAGKGAGCRCDACGLSVSKEAPAKVEDEWDKI